MVNSAQGRCQKRRRRKSHFTEFTRAPTTHTHTWPPMCMPDSCKNIQALVIVSWHSMSALHLGGGGEYLWQALASQPDICKQTTNRISGKHSRGISSRAQRPGYLCGDPGQISDTKTRPDIRQLHAGRYPSTARRQISVNCTQADIRQLHAGRYPSATHSRISVSCTQPDIWEWDGDRYLALRADQIPPDTNQISGSCGDDPTQWRPQISGICATGYLAWARGKDEDFFDQPDIWWYANQRRGTA